MKRLRKFLHLNKRDRQLLISTALLLGTIRLGLWLHPSLTLRRLAAGMIKTKDKLHKPDQVSVGRVVWAVEVVSRYMPGKVKCLARALATQVLLSRHGHLTQFRIGVAKSSAEQLEAHAWVESQGRVVIGGLKDLGRYTPLPSLEAKRS